MLRRLTSICATTLYWVNDYRNQSNAGCFKKLSITFNLINSKHCHESRLFRHPDLTGSTIKTNLEKKQEEKQYNRLWPPPATTRNGDFDFSEKKH